MRGRTSPDRMLPGAVRICRMASDTCRTYGMSTVALVVIGPGAGLCANGVCLFLLITAVGYPLLLRACMTDPYSLGDPDLFSPTSYTTANTGKPEGLHPITTTGGCCLQGPLWYMPKSVCWSDLSDTGSSAQRAQESTYTSANLAQSAIAEHAAQESHVIDWKEAKVVDTHPRYYQRSVLESWRIRSETTTMNRDDGNLPQAYNSLLNYPREPHTSH